jgi:hypothetical protein
VAEDIVERLRCTYTDDGCDQCTFCLARAEIERLRHTVDRLNAALDDITHLTSDRQILHRMKEARRG